MNCESSRVLLAANAGLPRKRIRNSLTRLDMTSFPESIVFAFTEDGGLQVFIDKEAAILEYEGIDVESDTVCFYESAGR